MLKREQQIKHFGLPFVQLVDAIKEQVPQNTPASRDDCDAARTRQDRVVDIPHSRFDKPYQENT